MPKLSTAAPGAIAAFVALAGSFAVIAAPPSPQFGLPVQWAISAALLVVFCAFIGVAISGRPAGLIIDNRNRVSLSKLQAAAWSVIVLSALATAVFSRIRLGSDQPVNIDLPGQLLAVMGISATSLVAAPVILSLKGGETPAAGQEVATAAKLGDDPDSLSSVGKVYARANASDAQWLDLFRGEEVSNAASPDLSKLQQFLITVVVLIAYGASLWALFSGKPPADSPHDWPKSLPSFSDNMAWLVGISHAGYLAYKAAPHGASAGAPTTAPTAPPAQDNAVG